MKKQQPRIQTSRPVARPTVDHPGIPPEKQQTEIRTVLRGAQPPVHAARTPMVRIQNLKKTYREGVDEQGKPLQVQALRGLSFDIYPGEFVAVTGANGSGKSTLLNCLGALDVADNAADDPIQYDDEGTLRSVWENPEWYRQNFVGIVFQDFHLLPTLNVNQNVDFPLRLRQCRLYQPTDGGRAKLVEQALMRVGAQKHRNKKVLQISGGERQRVAIARALVKEPRLLLADEPTGNLDREHKISIVKTLRDLAQGNLSVLMVTHDHELVKDIVDRTIHLADGLIDGNPSGGYVLSLASQHDSRSPIPPALEEAAGLSPAAFSAIPENEETLSQHPGAPVLTDSSEAGNTLAAPLSGEDETSGRATEAVVIQVVRPPSTDEPPTPELVQSLDSGESDRKQLPAIASPRKRAKGRRPFTILGCSMGTADLLLYSLRDTRQSRLSLGTNVFAILLGTFLTAMLLALLGGTGEYIAYLFRTVPGIDSVQVWVDYSVDKPFSADEVSRLSHWPGAVATVTSVNQFVPLFQKPTREVIASLFSTQPGDPELRRMPLEAGSRNVDPEGWDIVLPMRVATEINNFNPQGLVGALITLQLRRYERSEKIEDTKPTETLDYPVHVVGILKDPVPQDRVYGSINMVRFVRDFSTSRSSYVAEPVGRVDLSRISARTLNENLRIYFRNPAAAERAFYEMKHGVKQRFEARWPGEGMLYLRDVQTISTIVLIGIGLLAIVAGAVSIFNTLLASVTRKSREIGIMRAMGVARADVFLIFVFQSIIVGVVASMIGILVAASVVVPLNTYIASRWEQLAIAIHDIGGIFQFGFGMSVILIAAIIGICFVAAFIPSLHAASKTPMDALRDS